MRDLSIAKAILPLLALAAVLSLGGSDHERADTLLGTFYSQMLSSQFGAAQKSMDEAIRLWPGNARLYAWRAYCKSQRLPSQCTLCGGPPLSRADRETVQAAMEDYRASLALDPRDAVVHHNLG